MSLFKAVEYLLYGRPPAPSRAEHQPSVNRQQLTPTPRAPWPERSELPDTARDSRPDLACDEIGPTPSTPAIITPDWPERDETPRFRSLSDLARHHIEPTRPRPQNTTQIACPQTDLSQSLEKRLLVENADLRFSSAADAASLRINEEYSRTLDASRATFDTDAYCANETVVCWGKPSLATQRHYAGRYLSAVQAASERHAARQSNAWASCAARRRQLEVIRQTYRQASDRVAAAALLIPQLREI